LAQWIDDTFVGLTVYINQKKKPKKILSLSLIISGWGSQIKKKVRRKFGNDNNEKKVTNKQNKGCTPSWRQALTTARAASAWSWSVHLGFAIVRVSGTVVLEGIKM